MPITGRNINNEVETTLWQNAFNEESSTERQNMRQQLSASLRHEGLEGLNSTSKGNKKEEFHKTNQLSSSLSSSSCHSRDNSRNQEDTTFFAELIAPPGE